METTATSNTSMQFRYDDWLLKEKKPRAIMTLSLQETVASPPESFPAPPLSQYPLRSSPVFVRPVVVSCIHITAMRRNGYPCAAIDASRLCEQQLNTWECILV